jgi:predicted AlkP superfamily phosphohydrolase/phosphomutase
MEEKVQRIVVIGLDGATPQLIWPWIKASKLPTLAKLVAEGVHGDLRSTIPPISPTAWSSFATGKNPGQHGVFDHVRRRAGCYELEPINASKRRGQPLWRLLSNHGFKVGVVNVPGTYPPEPVNGYMVTGMFTPSKESTYTFPASLAQELDTATGGYALFSDARKQDDYDEVLNTLHDTRRNRVKAVSYLLGKYPTDFFMFVFDETDRAQHKFWKFMDPTHPRHQAGESKKYQNALLELHQQIDQDLAQILQNCDDETVVIVMSDHGFGPLYKHFYLNNWLLEQGYLKLRQRSSTQLKYLFYRLGITPDNLLEIIARLKLGLPNRVISSAKQARTRDRKSILRRLLLSVSDVDWMATTAYVLGGNLAGVYLNVKGREPQGVVERGPAYDQLRGEILEKLRSLQDPDTGDRIFAEIFTREEVYAGPSLEQAPDIVFMTAGDRYLAQGAHEYMFASNKMVDMPRWPPDSGTHQRDGILVMHGQPFQAGARLHQAEIIDLAPTILFLMGVPIPRDTDGQVLQSAFQTQYLAQHPIHYTTPTEAGSPSSEIGFSAEEEAIITERLESLGYLG